MAMAWRIVKTKHAANAFDGEGARINGGRWTSIGRPAVYVSSTVALATLEMLAHLASVGPLLSYSLFEVTFSDSLVKSVDIASLPRNWRQFPAPPELCSIGDTWLENQRSAVLVVPSAIVGFEYNYLLNPVHPDFSRIKIGPQYPYDLDPRLLSRRAF